MTYCVGILVRTGLVMIADTRTNAGLDNVATFRKLNLFERAGERVVVLASAGNLAVSQSVLSMMQEGIVDPVTGDLETVWTQPSMTATARFAGRAIREVHRLDGRALEQDGVGFEVSMLVGGQIAGTSPRLFMVYRAGNFIEATEETPYLQIGEHKYGKPILDRAITCDSSLEDSLKIGLISMDSTMRSNLGVGLPIDVFCMQRDVLRPATWHRIDQTDSYFFALREQWSAALRKAHQDIPRPPYGA